MNVLHAQIGQSQYEGRSPKSLADAGIFFYDHFYHLLDKKKTKGSIEKVSLQAEWSYIDWPIPDYASIESVKCKLFRDVQKSLCGAIPTWIVKIILFMPLTVFVELFCRCRIKISRTTLSCNNIHSILLERFFGCVLEQEGA